MAVRELLTERFEDDREHLRGVAFRILGSTEPSRFGERYRLPARLPR